MTSATLKTRNFNELSFEDKNTVLQIIDKLRKGKWEFESIIEYIRFYNSTIITELNNCFPICTKFSLEIEEFLKELKKLMRKVNYIQKISWISKKETVDECICNKINQFFCDYKFYKRFIDHESFMYNSIVIPHMKNCEQLHKYMNLILGLNHFLELLTIAIQMFTDESEECDYIAGHMIKCIKKYMDLDEIFLVRSKLIKQYFELEDIYLGYSSIVYQLRKILNEFCMACKMYVYVIECSRKNEIENVFKVVNEIPKMYSDIVCMISKVNKEIMAFSVIKSEAEVCSKMGKVKIELCKGFQAEWVYSIVW